MSIIYISPFEHLHKDGNYYTIEAEVWYTPPITDNKYTAECPADLYGEFDILEYSIYNEDGEEVSGSVYIPDKIIERQLEIQNSFDDGFVGFNKRHMHRGD